MGLCTDCLPLVYNNDDNSQWILRSASVHSSALRVLLRQIYQMLRNYGNMILAFNCAFEGGDHKALLKVQAFTLLIAYFHKMIIKILTI